jgi:hypothetical protein
LLALKQLKFSELLLLAVCQSQHMCKTSKSCSQNCSYTLKTLRVHGLPTAAIHTVYKSIILAKIMYAIAAIVWFGFASQYDKGRIDAFMRRVKRSDLCPVDVQTFTELGQTADKKRFRKVLSNSSLVHHSLCLENLTCLITITCVLFHDRLSLDRTDQLTNCNFVNRVYRMFTFIDCFSILPLRFFTGLINEYSMLCLD